jgi:hypothetical protein
MLIINRLFLVQLKSSFLRLDQKWTTLGVERDGAGPG